MRLLASLCAALVAVFVLFWVMQMLVLSGGGSEARPESFSAVDFVRVQREETVRTRSRVRPDPPETPERPPPPPDMEVQVEQPVAPDLQAFDIPQLALSTNISGGPFIGSFSPGTGAAGSGDGELIPLVRLTPRYPRNAARDGVEGEVRLEVVVRPDGTVREARVIEASPRGYFEAAAVSAALRGRFRPRTVGGEPVESTGQYTMIFRLE